MKENKGFFIACYLIGLAWVYAAYDADHSNSPLAMLLGLGSLASWLGLFVLAAYRIIKRNYLPWQKRLAPFWLLFTPLGISASYRFATNLFSAPDWLLIEHYDFTGSDNILLKKDGEYKYWRHGPLGRSGVVRGQYERRDSLLIMKPNSDVEMPAIGRIAIRPYPPFLRRENSLIQLVALDSAGNVLAIFRIKERTE